MARNGTYGDHITLQAIANLFNVQLVIYSTLGTLATQTITPVNGCPIATFYLGHFAEGAGEQVVRYMRVSTHVSKNDKKSHTNPSNPHKPHIISPQFLHKLTNTAFEFNNELLQRRRQKPKNLKLLQRRR